MSEIQKNTTKETRPSVAEEIKEKTKSSTAVRAERSPALPPHKEYARRILKYKNYYFQLLCIMGAIAAVGVVVAVMFNLLFGVSLAVFSAVIYAFLASDEMYKSIGIKYKSVVGGIKLISCRATYGNVLWIPSSLIGFDVIEIGDRAFSSPKNDILTRVFLPKTLKKIGAEAFADCEALKEIFFEGTETEWNKIEKNTDISAYKIIFEAKYPPIPKKKKKKKTSKKIK